MKKMSRILSIIGGALSLVTFLSLLTYIIVIFVLGTIAGITLLIVGLSIEDLFLLLFVEIGVPIMGGMWYASLIMLPALVMPFLGIIFGFLGGFMPKGKGKVAHILQIVFATYALVKGAIIVPAILILIGGASGVASVDEEKQKKLGQATAQPVVKEAPAEEPAPVEAPAPVVEETPAPVVEEAPAEEPKPKRGRKVKKES